MQRRLLSGTYECKLDDRFRLAIPARIREPFAAGATVGWWIDDCLIVVPSLEWTGLVERTFGKWRRGSSNTWRRSRSCSGCARCTASAS